jgi:hypothetical protein
MTLPLMLLDRIQAAEFSIRPNNPIDSPRNAPSFNKIPLQIVECFANHAFLFLSL